MPAERERCGIAAAEYLSSHYPNVQGFSPRNLRRMRNFYRTYEKQPELLSLALQLGWTQNIVIMEASLSMKERRWYLKVAFQFGWSKLKLIEMIESQVHLVHGRIEYDNEQRIVKLCNAIKKITTGQFRKRKLQYKCRGDPKKGENTYCCAL